MSRYDEIVELLRIKAIREAKTNHDGDAEKTRIALENIVKLCLKRWGCPDVVAVKSPSKPNVNHDHIATIGVDDFALTGALVMKIQNAKSFKEIDDLLFEQMKNAASA